jgi:hypothetical protein
MPPAVRVIERYGGFMLLGSVTLSGTYVVPDALNTITINTSA